MPFPPNVRDEAMVACERHCCLCHRLRHTKMQCHHIIPEADGGPDTFENCIPLCFDCHGEVEAYNPRHPVGTNYSARELKRRRDNWYKEVRDRRTVTGPARLGNEPLVLESFEEARILAETDPKNPKLPGVVRGWGLLAKAILKVTNVSGENVQPLSEDVRKGLKKIENSAQVPEKLFRSISDLQNTANQAVNQSRFAGYDPNVEAALTFISDCEGARNELVRIYNSGGL